MAGLFISNLNQAGAQSLKVPPVSYDVLSARLDDASASHIDNINLSVWDKSDKDPKAAVDFSKFLLSEDPLDSVVKFPQGIPLDGFEKGVQAEFDGDADKVKYIAAAGQHAEFMCDGHLYKTPLVVKVDSFADGILKGSLMTGIYNQDSNSYSMLNSIFPQDAAFFALSDIPDMSKIADDSQSSAVVLLRDCPAIRKDAKAGDVFIWGQSLFFKEEINSDQKIQILDSWIKLHSFKDKVDALMKAYNKSFNIVIDGVKYSLKPIFIHSDQNLSSQTADNGENVVESVVIGPSDEGAVYTVLKISRDNNSFEHLFVGERIVVPDVDGYDADGREPVDGSPLILEIVKFDAVSENPIVKALNGMKASPDDADCLIPGLPAGTKLMILDEREKVHPSLALIMNDLVCKIDAKPYQCRQGEFYIMVDRHFIPVEFDALFK